MNGLRKVAQAVWDSRRMASRYSDEHGFTDYWNVDDELLDALGAALAEPEWTRVKDGLPDTQYGVLVRDTWVYVTHCGVRLFRQGAYGDPDWLNRSRAPLFTHWQYADLPVRPEMKVEPC